MASLTVSNIDSMSHPLFEQAVAVMASGFCGSTSRAPEAMSTWCITGHLQEGPWTEAPPQEIKDVQEHWARLGFLCGMDTGGCFCVQDESEDGAPVVVAAVCEPPAKESR